MQSALLSLMGLAHERSQKPDSDWAKTVVSSCKLALAGFIPNLSEQLVLASTNGHATVIALIIQHLKERGEDMLTKAQEHVTILVEAGIQASILDLAVRSGNIDATRTLVEEGFQLLKIGGPHSD